MNVKKSSFNTISKRIGCLFFALLMMISIVTPTLAVTNVDGQGGTSSLQGVNGACTYNNADSMWKVTLYYSRYDTNTTDTSNLGNTAKWKQYGESFYVYHPTANRGASGKINLNFFYNALYPLAKEQQSNGTYKYFAGNKPYFLAKTSNNIANASIGLTDYDTNYIHFYPDTSSPAIAMNGYTIDAVKSYFESGSTLQKFIKNAYLTVGSSVADGFGNTTFSIDGFNGNYVDKKANSGKAQNGYAWSTATHLTHNDWYKGIKTDYKGKQIYIHPKIDSNGTFLNGVGWMVVYEPVLCVEPKTTVKIGNTTYKYVAATPTEFAILQYNKVIDLGTLASTVFGHLSNSTFLDKKWVGINAPSDQSSPFSATSSTVNNTTMLSNIYKLAGIGMKFAKPYNYVIKDYKAVLSAPKSVKAGEAFNVTFTHSNISEEWKGNTGKHESAINVKYVWVAYIKQGTQEYWFDLWNLRGKTLSKSTALKKSDGSLVTTYTDAASIVEARRANESNGLSPFNRNKHYYRGKYATDGKTPLNTASHTYSYTISSEFSGCNLDLRAYTNVDSVGEYTNSKKELNSGAYYKSGESQYWGNNRGRKVVSVTASPEVEPVISVQLNNKTSNEDLNLAGKRFAVWCIDSFSYQVLEISGKINKLPYF